MMAPPLLPVAREDKFFLLFEGLGAPVTAMWGLRFAGAELDRDRFREAAERTFARHPKAGCRLVRNPAGLPQRRRRELLAWEPIASAGATACQFHEPIGAPEVPSPSLDPYLEIMNAPLDSGTGPLVQLHWFPHREGDGTLAFRFHHAFADGFGSLMFLRDLCNHYNGLPPEEPAPDYAAAPAPLVPGTRRAKLRLFFRLLRFHFRRGLGYRFAPPAKLFDLRKRPGGRIDACARIFPAEQLSRYSTAAKRFGASLNDILLAAYGQALEAWLHERGLRCGTFRVAINQNLRSRDGSGPAIGNRSSAFPVWMGPDDRASADALVQSVHKQVQECLDQRIAEATAVLSVVLGLSIRSARWLVLPAATKPRVSDSLVLSNMGKVPGADGNGGWFRLGSARLVDMLPLGRPPDGIGAISFVSSTGGRLYLTLCFLTDLLDRTEVNRLLEILEHTLERLSAEAR